MTESIIKTIHIVNEVASGDLGGLIVRRFWCGKDCTELADGTFFPDLDFVLESQASWASCEACRSAFESRIVAL